MTGVLPKKEMQGSQSETPWLQDMVNHPAHYKQGGIETIEYLKAKLSQEEFVGYLRGNILKYVSRMNHKGKTAEDAAKAAWYCEYLSNFLKENT